MASVDNRIVSMEFDNSAFERKLSETIVSIEKLNDTVKHVGENQSFDQLSAAASRFDTSRMAAAIENISGKFTALGAIGFAVIQKLTQDVIGFATSKVQEDILGPIITGGRQRALNIEQAKFQFRGLGVDVQKGMDSALAAVKGTAFGLDEAAKAASQLSASGIETGDQMTSILRGIAGTAAMTGSSFTEMSDIFTASAGSGKVNTQDLLQFSTRGLNAAAAVAKQLGVTEAQVRDMASSGKLDFKTFADAMDKAFGAHATAANETYAGSLANLHAAFSRLGASFFSTKLEQQRDIFNALTPVVDNVNTALQPVIKAFLDLSAIGTFKAVTFLQNLDLKGFTAGVGLFAEGLRNIFGFLGQIGSLAKSAFRDIFPPATVSIWIKIGFIFREFTEHLKMGGETADKVKNVFRGLFSIFDIGFTVLKEVARIFIDLVGAIFPASTGLLDISSTAGTFLTKMDTLLVKGGKIHEFFEKLRDVVKVPIDYINTLKDTIAGFFGQMDVGTGVTDTASAAFGRVDSRFQNLKDAAEKVSDAWQRLQDRLQGVKGVFDKASDAIKNWFSELGQKLAAAFQPGDFNNALDLLNVGLLGGIAALLHKFLTDGLKVDLTGGVADKLKGVFDQLNNSLKAMQADLKAEALLKIAAALGILTASIVVLSLIDSAALTKALTAIAVGFAQLVLTMAAMDKIVGSAGSAGKLAVLGAALIEIAIAMTILSVAVTILSRLSWGDLAKGLVGVAVGLAILVGISSAFGEGALSMIGIGVGVTILATGLLILAAAVKAFSTMGWAEIGKGLVAIAGGLLIIATALNFMPASGAISGLGLIELAIGLTILAGAVKLFSLLGWAELFKGLIGIAAALLILTAALDSIPVTAPIQAAGLVIMGTALNIIAGAVALMGSMDLGTLAKGIGSILALLLILSAAMEAMQGAAAGALALIIVAGAMTVLTSVLITMSGLSWSDLLHGLVGMAAVLALLGVAALVMEPVIPALLGLGAALIVVGAGFALFGVGAYLVANALQAMAESGVAGAKAFVDSLEIVIKALPRLIAAVGEAILGSTEELLKGLPLLIRLLEAVLVQLLESLIKLIPLAAKAIGELIIGILQVIKDSAPEYVAAGFSILMSLLQGIRDNIGEIVTTVVEIVTSFIDALTAKLPDIATSVYNFILQLATTVAEKVGEFQTAFIPIGIAFIQGMLNGISQYMPFLQTVFVEIPGKVIGWIGDVIGTLWSKGFDLITGLLNGIFGKVGDVISWFVGLAGAVFGWVGDTIGTLWSKGFDLITGLLNGIFGKVGALIGWFGSLAGSVLGWIGNTLTWLVSKGSEIISGLINGLINGVVGLATWFETLPGKIAGMIPNPLDILKDIGGKIIDGLIDGLRGAMGKLGDFVGGIGGFISDHKGPPKVDRVLLIPAGMMIMQSLMKGLMDGWQPIESWLDTLNPADHIDAQGMADKLRDTVSKIPDALAGMDEFNPVITPMLDLTEVQAASSKIDKYMQLSPLVPQLSLDQARLISAATVPDVATAALASADNSYFRAEHLCSNCIDH